MCGFLDYMEFNVLINILIMDLQFEHWLKHEYHLTKKKRSMNIIIIIIWTIWVSEVAFVVGQLGPKLCVCGLRLRVQLCNACYAAVGLLLDIVNELWSQDLTSRSNQRVCYY